MPLSAVDLDGTGQDSFGSAGFWRWAAGGRASKPLYCQAPLNDSLNYRWLIGDFYRAKVDLAHRGVGDVKMWLGTFMPIEVGSVRVKASMGHSLGVEHLGGDGFE
jgi:hypothetical protein